MQILLKTKIGPFLVISSVLAAWTLLAAQPVQAHEGTAEALRAPTCSNLPTASDFYGTPDVPEATAAVTSAALTPSTTPKVGTGTAARGGYEDLRYAKITIPQLAAGELRVFDTRDIGVSDAILCRPGTDVTSRTSYSAHNAAHSAAARATAASTATNTGTNPSVSAASTALTKAADALTAVARALSAAGKTSAANTATGAAATARGVVTDTATNTAASDFTTPLTNAAGTLTNSATALHARFQIRTEVNPGDEEYILVIATNDDITWALQFHGAIATTAATQRQRTLNQGDQHTYGITVTAPGLLTVETTGGTDTSGMLSGNPAPMDDSSGSGNNFKIVAPVTTASYTVTVDGQTATTTGAYTLDMDFKVAMRTGLTFSAEAGNEGVLEPTFSGWTSTGIAADDTELRIQGSADEDYFLLTIDTGRSGFLTIEATDDMTSATDAATTGTFYGPTGELARDTNSGADSSHFKIRAPVEAAMAYLVKVTGTTGVYRLSVMLDQAEGGALIPVPGTQNAPEPSDCGSPATGEICLPVSGVSLETERFAFNIMESGALYLHTTGAIDTVGTLYGPGGGQIATDDNSGDGNNFRIAANVNAGLHLLEVRGKTRQTTGVYSLVTNFVAGAGPTTPTTPGTDDDDVASLQAEVDRLRNELNACRAPVVTNARGVLGNPPDGGYRSGVGLISGWVCAAEDVEVRIATDRGIHRRTLQVAYGTSRPDTVGSCGHENTGFGMTYNFNHLPEGMYTITAYADGDTQIGEPSTFEVVHLEEFAASDDNRFLYLDDDVQDRGVCIVPDFPATGERTWLKWEESTQNFVIEDAG